MSIAFQDGSNFYSDKRVFANLQGKDERYINQFREGFKDAADSDKEVQFWENMDQRATLGFQHERYYEEPEI